MPNYQQLESVISINNQIRRGYVYNHLYQMVRFSCMAMKDPTMLPPTSGNASLPGSGRTLPFRSISTGYFNRCPLMSETSSAANCVQFLSAIVLTFLTHSILSGCVKQSSKVAICSAQSDILYPQICTGGTRINDPKLQLQLGIMKS